MLELVDSLDLKSSEVKPRVGSTPTSGTGKQVYDIKNQIIYAMDKAKNLMNGGNDGCCRK